MYIWRVSIVMGLKRSFTLKVQLKLMRLVHLRLYLKSVDEKSGSPESSGFILFRNMISLPNFSYEAASVAKNLASP